MEELGAKPSKPKSSSGKGDDDEDDAVDGAEEDNDASDDWRKFFDDQVAEEKAAAGSAATKSAGARLYKLTLHQSLHSLTSHRAVFSRAWLTLLPLLSSGSQETQKAFVTRALSVMHRGVLPHLTRPILVMDWVASCVDFGDTIGLIALNALFTLMKEYNLCGIPSSLILSPN